MNKNKWNKIREEANDKEELFIKERLWTNRIVKIILLVSLVLLLSLLLAGGIYIRSSLQPVNPNNNQPIEVTIPIGSSSNDIAKILEEQGIVKNGKLFSYYLKFNNNQELQAGHYQFNPSMPADQVVSTLQAGGEPIFVDADTKLTVIEGMQLEDIANLVDENTAISKEEFMNTVNDQDFIRRLQGAFPSLLDGLLEIEGLKYPLEGYLFPATYEYFAGMNAEELITKMVEAANLTYQGLVDDLATSQFTYHQILTLASIIEAEAITEEDRGLVSGVFYNRLAAEMPLQSDVTVLYALGEHKEFVTYDDLEVESPYNLYQNTGLPPGPVNTPGLTAITAALYPTWNDYYYFVADLDTNEVYYSSTIEEHDALVEKYVNQRQEKLNSQEASIEESGATAEAGES
ncbi:endolytic transglycosylase MltG [Hutsoniella sourekii]|uniref:endolytic transglycosylase MltG n=1 Tax=Hutsoniella sourekii TaxID=87650 RepID=UPI000489C8E5|nr:endolytic transglycosylase MltG [Hutsoniella sourekii]